MANRDGETQRLLEELGPEKIFDMIGEIADSERSANTK